MHWYTKEGEPAYEIKGLSGKLRPTTLRDAKKLGLVPSVTTVMAILNKPALERWKIRKCIEKAYGLGHAVEGTDYKVWEVQVLKEIDKESTDIMARGTEIHDTLEKWFKGEKVVGRSQLIDSVIDAMPDDYKWIAEESFSHESGYGGKVDLHSETAVLDFKTKAFTDVDQVSVYDEHAMQLAAYRKGLSIPDAPCYNLFISTEVPGLVHLHKWKEEEIVRAERMFFKCLELWQLINKHDSSFK